MRPNHTIDQTDILFFFTNTPCPRLQKKIKIASKCGRTTVIYWQRSVFSFETGLKENVLEIPIQAVLFSGRGLWRILSFLIFIRKALPLLHQILNVKKIYVDYLDVLIIISIFIQNSNIEIIYEVGDLVSLQYGGHPIITYIFSRLEKILLRRVCLLVLSSPFFWSEYYKKIYKGNWMLIENLPEQEVWNRFVRKHNDKKCVVGFIGSIRYAKPIECLLQTTKEMRDSGYDMNILFAGTGPDANDIYHKTKGLSYITFIGPYEYEKDAPSLYGKVDIIFSVYDTSIANVRIALPNRFYESIVCGLPIIVAKGTCLEKYVMKYDIGYSVAYSSISELQLSLESHYNRDRRSLRIRKALDSINKEEFFYDKYYPQLVRLFAI